MSIKTYPAFFSFMGHWWCFVRDVLSVSTGLKLYFVGFYAMQNPVIPAKAGIQNLEMLEKG